MSEVYSYVGLGSIRNVDRYASVHYTDTYSGEPTQVYAGFTIPALAWIVTKSGAVLTANSPPTAVSVPYTLNFATADMIIKAATGNANLAERTTYSFLFFGQSSGTGVKAPFGSTFRNRLK